MRKAPSQDYALPCVDQENNARHVQNFWKQVAEGQSPRDIDQDGSERLDAIDTVKRFALLSKRFTKKFNIPNHRVRSKLPLYQFHRCGTIS